MCETSFRTMIPLQKVPIDAQLVDLQNYDFVVIANFGA
jgi:hypothetical protein